MEPACSFLRSKLELAGSSPDDFACDTLFAFKHQTTFLRSRLQVERRRHDMAAGLRLDEIRPVLVFSAFLEVSADKFHHFVRCPVPGVYFGLLRVIYVFPHAVGVEVEYPHLVAALVHRAEAAAQDMLELDRRILEVIDAELYHFL